ncbi:MAG: peptidoglycan-binding domain-containing protein [bacterium]|nr:peptidoglycan-binding domain-containing protein [bacterium]
MNRFTITVARATKKALLGALMFASAILPSIQAFMPTVVSADTAVVNQVFVFDQPRSGTFVVPSNATSITVRAWGAGGKGGDGTTISGITYAGQGGGAGGFAAQTVNVTGGASFGYIVGQGGTSADRTGGQSSFNSIVSASGGNGGANWDEISGNGPTSPPTPTGTNCYWTHVNEETGNEYGVTCRDLSAAMKGFFSFFSTAVAYAQVVFDGRGGEGLVGSDLHNGGDAAAVIAGPNSSPTAGGASALGGRARGGDGSSSGTGSNGNNGRIEVIITSVVGSPSDVRPDGHLDTASCSAITGWAYDPDDATANIPVHFYAGGPAGSGTFIGSAVANVPRPDVNTALGIPGDHGFIFDTPNSLKDGGTHQIYAYGINIVELIPTNNYLLASTTPVFVSGCQGGTSNAVPVVVSVTGTTTGSVNVSYVFTATATDPEGQDIEYGFDWNNNGTIEGSEGWTPAVTSGTPASRSFSWSMPGVQNFQVFARDSQGGVSTAFPFQITISGGSSNIGLTLLNTTGLSTSESGGTANFGVVLNSAPLANVTLPVVSTDTTEGVVSTPLLVFTPANWNIAQFVTVTGVDDTIVDGPIAYSIIIGGSSSDDINFNNLPVQTVNLINHDDDKAPSTGGSRGGYRGGGPCFGFGCPVPVASTTPDIIIIIDGPVVAGPVTSVTPTVPKYCLVDDFIADYARIGASNNPNEVRKIQYFLNTYENAGLPVDGEFGVSTEAAVMAFQAKYAGSVLSPWGTNVPTGIVYITTRAEMNRIYCADNPNYRDGDLSDILDGVLYPPANPIDFDGVIGSTEATSTNIAGVFGAITEDILNLLRNIPWYPLLVILLVLIGAGLMTQGIIKDIWNKDNILSFTQGSATFGIGSVLNVLNVVAYMISPAWLAAYLGVDISWLLVLVLINLLVLVALLIVTLFAINRRLAKGEPVSVPSVPVQPIK